MLEQSGNLSSNSEEIKLSYDGLVSKLKKERKSIIEKSFDFIVSPDYVNCTPTNPINALKVGLRSSFKVDTLPIFSETINPIACNISLSALNNEDVKQDILDSIRLVGSNGIEGNSKKSAMLNAYVKAFHLIYGHKITTYKPEHAEQWNESWGRYLIELTLYARYSYKIDSYEYYYNTLISICQIGILDDITKEIADFAACYAIEDSLYPDYKIISPDNYALHPVIWWFGENTLCMSLAIKQAQKLLDEAIANQDVSILNYVQARISAPELQISKELQLSILSSALEKTHDNGEPSAKLRN